MFPSNSTFKELKSCVVETRRTLNDNFDFARLGFIAVEIMGYDDHLGGNNKQKKTPPKIFEKAFHICYSFMSISHFEVDDISISVDKLLSH